MRLPTRILPFTRSRSAHDGHAVTVAITILAVLATFTACHRAPATRVIVMSGTSFAPVVDTVHVGDTVVWKNDDLVSHTATANDSSFSSGNLDVGQVWRTDALAAGTHAYRCLYHTGMVGTLVVR